MIPPFRIEALAAQDRSGFSCGSPALDRYLREQASQDEQRRLASCFLLIEGETGEVVGFYTLAAASIAAVDLSPETIRRLPRYPLLPVALIGRLAVAERYRGKGLGAALLADAAARVMDSAVKAFAIMVDAKDDTAKAFYVRFGFTPFVTRPQSLYLPLATFKAARQT